VYILTARCNIDIGNTRIEKCWWCTSECIFSLGTKNVHCLRQFYSEFYNLFWSFEILCE